MQISIGLPATIPGVDGETIIRWAQRAEERGFSSLGVVDRLVYGNYEPLVTLAAAAAVTSRIRLVTAILIVPYRINAALLGKQAASVDVLSGGRLTLGVGIGGRDDDYEISGVDVSARGRMMDDQLATMRRVWSNGEVGPSPVSKHGPPLLVGGSSEAAFRRAAHADGWIAGALGPAYFAHGAERACAAWREAGREGRPRLVALAYFALGPGGDDAAQAHLGDYYAWLGATADAIVAAAATDGASIRDQIEQFARNGCDELIFLPCAIDVEQVDLLADAALVGAEASPW